MLSDDEALVRVARSTPEGFAALYARYYPTVIAFVYRRRGDRAQTEDITAQTFVQALQAFQRYEGRGAPLEAWLVRSAANALADQARRRRRMTLCLLPDDAAGAAAMAQEKWLDAWERASWLRAPLRALSVQQRRALWLHFGEGYALREVAARLGRSEGATTALLHRTLKTLRVRRQAEAVPEAEVAACCRTEMMRGQPRSNS